MGICSSRKSKTVLVDQPIHTKKDQSILIEQEVCKPSASDYKDEGNRAFKSGDYPKAIQAYTKAIELKTDDSTYYSNRALCYFRIEKYEDSLSDCKKAISFNPQNTRAIILSSRSGLILFLQSLSISYLTEAEDDCEKAISGYNQSNSKENEKYCKSLRTKIGSVKKIHTENASMAKTKEILNYYTGIVEANLLNELKELLETKEKAITAPLVCCISFEFFAYPVTTAEGFTYEKNCIEHFLRNSSTDPISRRCLNNTALYPNIAIRKLVTLLKLQQPWTYYEIRKGAYPPLEV